MFEIKVFINKMKVTKFLIIKYAKDLYLFKY